MSRDMTKPTKWLCAQRRLRSAWASAQSDQSLRCPHEESLGPELPIERTAKTLIRLGGCPGWSESSLGAHSFCWFCHVAAHIIIRLNVRHTTACAVSILPCFTCNWWGGRHRSRINCVIHVVDGDRQWFEVVNNIVQVRYCLDNLQKTRRHWII